MVYETVIGLEVHAQLLTASKMFCQCSTNYVNAPPNTHVCPVCLGMPGVLPVINQKAVEYTIMTALALNCSIPTSAKFDRKNYPYPDLMKGYQISQYDMPLGIGGWLTINVEGNEKRIGITRVHLEEDTAKLVHRLSPERIPYSLVDVNRSGVPLMEIVSDPDLRSPEEARQYLIKLRSILQYLGVSSGIMEEGSFRCDANISLRPQGSSEFWSKVEVKNMNSFRAVFRALTYEVERQEKAHREGERIVQETRGWVDEKGMTVSQRTKEYAHDYRYFPEPDLPPLTLSSAWVEEIKARLPELPDARCHRLISQYDLPLYDAALLTSSKAMADFFEACLMEKPQRAKVVSNWILGELSHLINVEGIEISQAPITPTHLVEMLDFIEEGTLNLTIAKEVLEEMFHTGKAAAQIIEERGLTQISDVQELEELVERILAAHSQAALDFKAGKNQAISFLIGRVMKETRGRANPTLVNRVLKEKLEKGV
ncbi:MAG: Asp-tRNA(Asn)/Glu-tRNA(Gln) amidotransferase subunit GatB [Chloroflexi bacterium]|nr:Asp-tRNA(Asn)/Glu-tRNA(Gln) amidotransferase subunit GatB [Chloroflexota bacterium]